MRIEYDQEADALYIQFREVPPHDNVDVVSGVTVDLDRDGDIIGIEILDAAERFGLESLANVTIENMPIERATA